MRDSFNEINITPLTDIFLVLLIIMMVIAPLLDQQGLNLTVPDMVESQDIKDSKILNVLVTNDNKIIVDNQQMELSDIEHIIKSKSLARWLLNIKSVANILSPPIYLYK